MNDVMTALHDWVVSLPSVSALVDTRVYVNRVPRGTIEAADTFHPEKMLVLRQSGGQGKADTLNRDLPAINILCYGESDFEADRVRRAVWSEFVHMDRVRQGDVMLYDINPTGGPIPLVDPDIVWPAVSQSFTLQAADI